MEIQRQNYRPNQPPHLYKCGGNTFRLIAPCFVTGEAAGTAAALAALSGKSPRDVDIRTLQKTLVGNGVYL